MIPNLPVKRRPNWDWSGAVPNTKIHMAWCNNWNKTFGNDIVLSEKYVQKCINKAICEIEMNELSKKCMKLSKDMGLNPIITNIVV